MSVNRFADTVSKLQQLGPWEVPTNAEVQNHIVTLYNQVHGEGGEAFAERESRFINRIIIDDKAKWNVTPLSVFLAYVDLAVKDLTLEPGAQAMCYLLSRSAKVPQKDKSGKIVDGWENRCYLAVTGYGEILLRQRAGQIRHCDTPTVVYEGDEFSYIERGGRKEVAYGLNIKHNPGNPIACFMKITRIDGTSDYAIILPEGWQRLQNYSLKQNERGRKDKENAKANDLYSSGVDGSIDPGFLIAKCVKHAFKNYPKLPIGKGMVMEADLPEEEVMPDYYSMEGSEAPEPEKAPQKPESFAEPADHSEGVTVDPAEYGDDSFNDGTF
ncbi:MAG: recombinase RecT [Muribaculaceae bacterium]|nr:recombinase RecT [Muribaculaceae bacterium]